MLRELVNRLKQRRRVIVRTVEVKGVYFDPTYGPRSTTEAMEVIDFDKLLREIDEFATSLKEEKRC